MSEKPLAIPEGYALVPINPDEETLSRIVEAKLSANASQKGLRFTELQALIWKAQVLAATANGSD